MSGSLKGTPDTLCRSASVSEELLMCWVVPGYLFSLRFFMDTCPALSLPSAELLCLRLLEVETRSWGSAK